MFRLVIEIDDDFTRLVDEDNTVIARTETVSNAEDMYYYLIGHLCSHFTKLHESKEEIEKGISGLCEGKVCDKAKCFAAKSFKGAVIKYLCNEG